MQQKIVTKSMHSYLNVFFSILHYSPIERPQQSPITFCIIFSLRSSRESTYALYSYVLRSSCVVNGDMGMQYRFNHCQHSNFKNNKN